MNRLVAFVGPAGCGKSTAADALCEQGWVRAKFADPLKNMMRAYYQSCGIDDFQYIEARVEGDLKEEPDPFLHGRTPRHAMQTLGTEWGRNLISTELWVRAWEHRVTMLGAAGADVVVDDCRFPNEAAAVRRLGGRVVQILGREKGLCKLHESEKMDFEPDMKVANLGKLSAFTNDVIHLFHHDHYQ